MSDSTTGSGKISAVVLTFNEEAVIDECLAGLSFADELLVVDSFSTDRTVEIARRHTDRILQHRFEGYGAQKNWAYSQAANEWILNVDADERVTPELAREVRAIAGENPAHNGYWITRRNFFLGKEIRYSWSGDEILRFFRKGKGRYPDVIVHSELALEGTLGKCRGTLLHHAYRTIDDYLRRLGVYSGGGAKDAEARGRRSGGWTMFGHCAYHFFKTYFVKRGFLDGTEGLMISLMGSFSTFLKYAKLYERQRGGRR